jgi:16S rRNA (uracil1498-N3)-methyltransferase
LAARGAFALAVGPEGGFEPHERDTAIQLGWRPAAIGTTTLRFETAAIAGISVIRASHVTNGGS